MRPLQGDGAAGRPCGEIVRVPPSGEPVGEAEAHQRRQLEPVSRAGAEHPAARVQPAQHEGAVVGDGVEAGFRLDQPIAVEPRERAAPRLHQPLDQFRPRHARLVRVADPRVVVVADLEAGAATGRQDIDPAGRHRKPVEQQRRRRPRLGEVGRRLQIGDRLRRGHRRARQAGKQPVDPRPGRHRHRVARNLARVRPHRAADGIDRQGPRAGHQDDTLRPQPRRERAHDPVGEQEAGALRLHHAEQVLRGDHRQAPRHLVEGHVGVGDAHGRQVVADVGVPVARHPEAVGGRRGDEVVLAEIRPQEPPGGEGRRHQRRVAAHHAIGVADDPVLVEGG